ncbi:tRNA lysidine(34) synthetase TilS [Cellulomonas sp. SLBN-39]|uniref:tRNA lysidine(34) synthetase TilS n=1 Tax=Cellulomonas sp. SLBN-39 TaxID=2768446 RepID=UPI001150720F|nr:tRNA lysidine(34) synthetase TilS [Cellulomonas sp. SLBN-39]TQL01717.1 tRNA(Ile)-lysidine synthase [Cellulomonas sp. SLBN-39]
MGGPPPAVAAVRVAVRAALADLPTGAPVLVACSGGADSLALAAAVAHVCVHGPAPARPAGAVVVDHGLQPGSADVARAAAAACRGLGLDPVRVVTVEVQGSGGAEAAARTARYGALDAVADEVGAAAVLLGHTLDDQAEQVLLALARGSGARALAGMRPVRGRLRRPLLGLRRADTEAVCAALGLVPWHDPTNGRPGAPETPPDEPVGDGADDVPASLPLRSRVRAEVLPVLEDVLGPGVAQALARTAAQLAEDADALDAAADALLRAALVAGDAAPGAGAAVVVDVDVLGGGPVAVRRRALRAAAVRAGAPSGSVARSHVLALDALVVGWHGQGPAHLPGRVVARRACGRLYLGRPTGPDHVGAHADHGHDGQE